MNYRVPSPSTEVDRTLKVSVDKTLFNPNAVNKSNALKFSVLIRNTGRESATIYKRAIGPEVRHLILLDEYDTPLTFTPLILDARIGKLDPVVIPAQEEIEIELSAYFNETKFQVGWFACAIDIRKPYSIIFEWPADNGAAQSQPFPILFSDLKES